MREVHELDIYRLAERLSDMMWKDYDKWPAKAQNTLGVQALGGPRTGFALCKGIS